MDTYTRMCDCEEIQNAVPLEPGARIWLPAKGTIPATIEVFGEDDIGEGNSDGWNKGELKDEGCVILPRQEDIQEMLAANFTTDGMLDGFHMLWDSDEWDNEESPAKRYPGVPEGHGIWGTFHTITELWLAFYMLEIHNKRWTAEGWV